MRTDIKKAWIKALRSKKYKQGTGWLRRGDRYCCLGVLCDIGAYDGWQSGHLASDPSVYVCPNMEADDAILPEYIQMTAGISIKLMNTLMRMNDEGYSFRKIAKYIEQYA